MRRAVLLTILTLLALSACGGGGDPVGVVESYLQAKVESDRDTIAGLLCSEMESFLERESRTFDSVSDVHIEDMSCSYDDGSAVMCEGRIVALYGTEETDFPLTTYRVVQEDGEWKWCGESGP